jgi:hypothetical protein
MKFQVKIEVREASDLGCWKNARKEFVATSVRAAEKKAEKELTKLGLHRYGDYNILDITKA